MLFDVIAGAWQSIATYVQLQAYHIILGGRGEQKKFTMPPEHLCAWSLLDDCPCYPEIRSLFSNAHGPPPPHQGVYAIHLTNIRADSYPRLPSSRGEIVKTEPLYERTPLLIVCMLRGAPRLMKRESCLSACLKSLLPPPTSGPHGPSVSPTPMSAIFASA